MSDGARVLIVGGGGRSHALGAAIAASPGVAKVVYAPGTSGLEYLGYETAPVASQDFPGLVELAEMEESEVCCGFGGTFCVKYPQISERLVGDKVRNIGASGADTVLGGDLGCLLNMAGRLRREQVPVRVFHVVEVLADMATGAAIGEPDDRR